MASEKKQIGGFERAYIALPQASAQTYTGTIFIADKPYELVGVQVAFTVANGGALTFDVKKCTGTQTPAAGTTCLLTTFDMNGTINTVVKKTLGLGTLSATSSTRFLAVGDRLALVASGASTSLAGAIVILTFRPTGQKANIY